MGIARSLRRLAARVILSNKLLTGLMLRIALTERAQGAPKRADPQRVEADH